MKSWLIRRLSDGKYWSLNGGVAEWERWGDTPRSFGASETTAANTLATVELGGDRHELIECTDNSASQSQEG